MPQVAAAAAIAIATTAVQSNQARKQQRAAERYRKRQEMLETANALAAQRIALSEIASQQFADSDAAAVEIEANRREAARAKGTATTIAGEAGAFGLSYEGLVGEFERQQAEFEGAVQTNLAIKRQFADLNIQSAALNTNARIINAQTQPVPRPNYANYAIQGIGTGLSIYSNLPKSK
jgi:predicted component of type VI protein secretion system